MTRLRGLHAVCAAAALVVALAGRAPLRAADETAPCDVRAPGRIVAVGDVHGAYDRFVAILRAAGLVDGRGRWAGANAILVQTGDVLDRGPDSRRVLDLLRRLERDAPRSGGRVVALLGNHEVMGMVGDFRYVSAGEYAAFRTPDSEAVRERLYRVLADENAARAKAAGQEFDAAAFRKRFLDQTPLGFVELTLALGPKGEYGAWLRQRPALARINGISFVHGGVTPAVADLGCAGLNAAIAKEVAALPLADPGQAAKLLATREDGPLWFRGLALENETGYAASLDATLGKLGARAIVIGHTVAPDGRVTPRFGGRVLQIDTGMLGGSFFPGGRASALEIDGERLTAIYEDGREELRVTLSRQVAGAAPPPGLPRAARH
jgi:hypothetical protein